MATPLKIRCKDLGVDHEGFVTGASLEDLVNCIEQEFKKQYGTSALRISIDRIRDACRSALLQTSRPANFRSVRLAQLVA